MHRHFRLPALAALFLSGAFSVWAADCGEVIVSAYIDHG